MARALTMTAAEIASILGGRRSGAGWKARCPAHDDSTPSLSLDDKEGQVLVHCHAGCSQRDVIHALELRGANLSRTIDRQRPERPLTKHPICDGDGNVVAFHVRQDLPSGKRMWWEQPGGTRGLGGRSTSSLPLYRINAIRELPPGELPPP